MGPDSAAGYVSESSVNAFLRSVRKDALTRNGNGEASGPLGILLDLLASGRDDL
jgi:hypothetical protein